MAVTFKANLKPPSVKAKELTDKDGEFLGTEVWTEVTVRSDDNGRDPHDLHGELCSLLGEQVTVTIEAVQGRLSLEK